MYSLLSIHQYFLNLLDLGFDDFEFSFEPLHIPCKISLSKYFGFVLRHSDQKLVSILWLLDGGIC